LSQIYESVFYRVDVMCCFHIFCNRWLYTCKYDNNSAL